MNSRPGSAPWYGELASGGIYISEDPIGWASGQTNNYSYVGGDPVSNTDPSGEIAPLVAMGIGALVGGGIDLAAQLISNGGNLSCVDWGDVGIAAMASISPAGRLGYKATIEGRAALARTLTKREAYDMRAQIKRDYRLDKVDDILKRRDRPFEQVADPRESFPRSHPGWDIGLTAPGAATLGAVVGSSGRGSCQ